MNSKIIVLSSLILFLGIFAFQSRSLDPSTLHHPPNLFSLLSSQVAASLHRLLLSLARSLLWLISWTRLPSYSSHVHIRLAAHAPGSPTVRWDSHGVPHILADDIFSASFASGFVQAQDRLFQLDFCRRLCAARLHELFGAQVLPLDRALFDLQLAEIAASELVRMQQRPDAQQFLAVLSNYTAGVNAYLSSDAFRLPVEYSVLFPSLRTLLFPDSSPIPRFSVQEFVAHCLMQTWIMSRGGEHELVRAFKLASSAPEPLLREILGFDHLMASLSALHLPDGVEWNHLPLRGLDAASPQASWAELFPAAGGGSNAWTVSGSLTASGSPILAGDPHLPPTLPGPWYALHLKTRDGKVDCAGMSTIGFPLVTLGHNQHVAWSVTLSFADTIDYFVEQVRNLPNDYYSPKSNHHHHNNNNHNNNLPPQYLFKGEWRNLKVNRKTVQINGHPVHFVAYASHHGPLLSSFTPSFASSHPHLFGPGRAISMSSVVHTLRASTPAPFADPLLDMMWASNFSQFRGAFRDFELPLNIVYADRLGNIGNFMAGKTPVRPVKGSGPLVPSEGWTGASDWQSFLPSEELPAALNPQQGFVVSANNRQILPEKYSHYISDFYAHSGAPRAARASQILAHAAESGHKITPEDVNAMHWDAHSDTARQVLDVLLPELEKLKGEKLKEEHKGRGVVLEVLRQWDCVMDQRAVGPSVFHAVMHHFLELVFHRSFSRHFDLVVGEVHTNASQLLRGRNAIPVIRLVSEYSGRDHLVFLELLQLATQNASLIVEAAGGVQAILREAIDLAVEELGRLLGKDPSNWQWGKLHTITWMHPMGRKAPGDALFNLGPIPVDGDETCVCHSARTIDGGYTANGFVPSCRLVYDLSDWDRSTEMLPPGQSGNSASPFFFNSQQVWATHLSSGFPHHYSESSIQQATISEYVFE